MTESVGMNKLVDVIKRDNSKTLSVDRNDRIVGAIESVGTNVCIDVNERGEFHTRKRKSWQLRKRASASGRL